MHARQTPGLVSSGNTPIYLPRTPGEAHFSVVSLVSSPLPLSSAALLGPNRHRHLQHSALAPELQLSNRSHKAEAGVVEMDDIASFQQCACRQTLPGLHPSLASDYAAADALTTIDCTWAPWNWYW
jgi:hypothetical protein